MLCILKIVKAMKAKRETEIERLIGAALHNSLLHVKAIVHRGFADVNFVETRVSEFLKYCYNH